MAKTEPSDIGYMWGQQTHWTHNAKGKRVLHDGDANKCRRVHRDERGQR